jgi:hypothetical protein
MKKINFSQHVLPHLIAVVAFLLVTVVFFRPFFFENKIISQYDIQQFEGSAKTIIDYREKTGEEPLWVNSMFSGMPAYMVSVKWDNGPVAILKSIIAIGIGHPVANIFCAFACYYILLLSFGVRPYLAIGGALAFGLSSYMIVGMIAGHNGRVGAIAFVPLALAGIHLVFSGRKILGFGLTAAGLALHLRENHTQITYYMLIMVAIYGLIQLIGAIREKKIADFAKTVGLLIAAVILAVGTYFGQFWALKEYAAYSKRGKSELNSASLSKSENSGLNKEFAFEFSNGILEPLTLLIPNIYGGSSADNFAADQESKTYRTLASSNNPQVANQLVRYASAYWGPQRLATAYYAGAVIIFLFAVGIAFADKKHVWWLVSATILSIMLSWGSNMAWFNYFLFDYLPGYNMFRSVTFALVIALIAMPLLGFIGLEKIMQTGLTKEQKKKLLIVVGSTGGLCLFFLLFGGMLSFTRDIEAQMPAWFTDALIADRKSLLRGDAFRSIVFILLAFTVIYFEIWKKISPAIVYAFFVIIILVDIWSVDARYFSAENNFARKREIGFFKPTEADQLVLRDKSYYRVYDISEGMSDARSSYFHHSVGGYHGAKIRRYEDLYDSCLIKETEEFFQDAQAGQVDFQKYGVINMLNVKYIMYGPDAKNVFPNPSANGPAWFVQEVQQVKSPAEELQRVGKIDTRTTAVIDESQFRTPSVTPDSAATITLVSQDPKVLVYESESAAPGLAVFSEIYYPKGWKATIDGTPADILRADYVLRALAIPAGKHKIEFRFEPDAYYVGNKVTMASSWLVLLVLLGSIGWSLKKEE